MNEFILGAKNAHVFDTPLAQALLGSPFALLHDTAMGQFDQALDTVSTAAMALAQRRAADHLDASTDNLHPAHTDSQMFVLAGMGFTSTQLAQR